LSGTAPTSVLINADWEILQTHGATGDYLKKPSAKARPKLLKLVPKALLIPLRVGLEEVRKSEAPVRKERVRIKFRRHLTNVNLEIIPIISGAAKEHSFLVIFESVGIVEAPKSYRAHQRRADLAEVCVQLQQELHATRAHLRSVVEKRVGDIEELQRGNEELRSSNKELENLNLQMDDVREQLQTTNEELLLRNEEVLQINDDLLNLLSTIQMPIVMLDCDLRVRRFTSTAQGLVNIGYGDIGRRITEFPLKLDLPRLSELLEKAMDTVHSTELEIQAGNKKWYRLLIRPYVTREKKVEGVVIAMVDIDQLKRDREKLRQLVELSFEPMIVWDFEKGVVEWNQGCERLYGFTREEAIGRVIHDLLQTERPLPLKQVEELLTTDGEWKGELRHRTKDGRTVFVDSRQQIAQIAGRPVVLETNRDITDRKLSFELMRESEARFRIMADSAPVPIWVNSANGHCEFVNKAYLDFFGKALVEVTGILWEPHPHPDDQDHYFTTYFAAFNALTPFRCQARFFNADGEYRWLESVALPRLSPSGKFLGYVGASLDITETKRAELHTQFINRLDLALSQITDQDEIIRLTTNKLGEYLDATRCFLSELDGAAGTVFVNQNWQGWLNGVESITGSFRISDCLGVDLREVMAKGQPTIINNVSADPRTRDHTATFDSLGIGASICMPILSEGRWTAILVVSQSLPRDWRADETQLVRDIATRLWLGVKQARAVAALHESESRARRTLADQMVAGVAECDLSGKFTLVNQRYCDITGRTKEELLGLRISDVTHPDDWPSNAELYRRLFETGESFFLEKRYCRKDGSNVWVNTHVSPIRDTQGEIAESVAVVIDVTDRKRAEQELRAAYERAEAAARAKDEFLSVVSHELRTPLVSILGYAQLLKNHKAPDGKWTRRMLEIIEQNSRMQLQLIEDLLDTTRIITGKLKLEVQPLDLRDVIRAALDVMRPAAQAKQIELRSALNPLAGQITGDPDRLQQVVWNLISNAIKFTPIGGLVEVTLDRTDPYVEIVVRDNGKGIDPEFLPYLFERFRQRDMSSTRRAGGLGLGLSLVKYLVELHGGRVEAASKGVDEGSTFTIRLPMRAIYTAPPRESKPTLPKLRVLSEPLAGVRVLIIDDEESVRNLLAMTPESYGATVHAVASGNEVLELLLRKPAHEQFDVLISDIAMPGEDGYTVMPKVRALPQNKGGDVPAIALTAYGRPEDRVRALDAGFQMHLAKPVKPEELVVVIQGLIGKFRLVES
jgi:PAS domain S-box-containing protein